ncbi:MAG: hypothetical protein D6769_03205 [Methanobacteriota archaeon]|nr:MAG: hypothetical protein D6769_03205 [Euryarchaeota archaeon]
MDYHKLREIEREELESGMLAKVSPTFYGEAKALLQELKKKASEQPSLYYREYEGAERSFSKIITKRLEKIMLNTAKNEEISNLVGPEIDLHTAIRGALTTFNSEVEGSEPIKEAKQDKDFTPEGKMKIVTTKYVDAYIAPNGEQYGPYAEGEHLIIDAGEAKWLIDQGYAKKLDD